MTDFAFIHKTGSRFVFAGLMSCISAGRGLRDNGSKPLRTLAAILMKIANTGV